MNQNQSQRPIVTKPKKIEELSFTFKATITKNTQLNPIVSLRREGRQNTKTLKVEIKIQSQS